MEKKDLISSDWRIRNLYSIKNVTGDKILFVPNREQEILLTGMSRFCLVLKARQLGITTFFCLYVLDKLLFNPNIQAGIIAHNLSDAENIFRDKLKFAYDNLPLPMRLQFPTIGDNAKELAFANGSSIRVGTSLRSSTLQYLHVSEFGKICIKYPERAREIITGSFNTIHAGQHIFVESTAEGNEGKYFEMCQEAQQKKESDIGPLDFKFFFFPWWEKKSYSLQAPDEKPDYPANLQKKFVEFKDRGISLSDDQRFWYFKKWSIQQEDMSREFPSYPDEAFMASDEGYWYSYRLAEIRGNNQIKDIGYDRTELVYTSWDLGQADPTSIWFFQIIDSKIFVIDFIQFTKTHLDLISESLRSKKYNYGSCIWPHDAKATNLIGDTFSAQARVFGWEGIVLENSNLIAGINLVRMTLSKCFFDRKNCSEGLSLLGRYKKKWNDQIGGWSSIPVHDLSSHAADSFRYLCHGYKKVGFGSSVNETFDVASQYLNHF